MDTWDWRAERWILETADSIRAAGHTPALWPDVLDRMARAWPGVKILFWGAPNSERVCTGGIEFGFSPDLLTRHMEYYAAISPWLPALQALSPLDVRITDENVPWWSFSESEFYIDFVKPEGDIECSTGVKICEAGERSAFFCVHYGSDISERYNRTVPAMLSRLAPALRGALDLNRELAGGSADPTAGVLEALSVPAIVLDRHGAPQFANRLAAGVLDEGELVRLDVCGRVRTCDRSATSTLLRRLQRLCRVGAAPGGEVPIRSREGRALALMSLFPIDAAATRPQPDWLFPAERLALLLLRPLARRTVPSTEALRLLFALTPAEARLAARLAVGESLAEAAAALRISKETARVHLRAVFAKTETHRQAELVALVSSLPGGTGGYPH